MADRPHGQPVRIIGEERLHPALRKLGRACIALVRWQREQQQITSTPVTDRTASDTDNGDQPTSETETSAVPDQERRHG